MSYERFNRSMFFKNFEKWDFSIVIYTRGKKVRDNFILLI